MIPHTFGSSSHIDFLEVSDFFEGGSGLFWFFFSLMLDLNPFIYSKGAGTFCIYQEDFFWHYLQNASEN